MLQRLFFAAALAAVTLLTACETYDFTVNDKLIYTPKPLFSNFEIGDEALHACVSQSIAEKKITQAALLVDLNCSHAGIESLSGLGTFIGLRRLKLSSNSIHSLSSLAALNNLEELYLDDNRIVELSALYPLSNLLQLDLAGNADLKCPAPQAFIRIDTLTLPSHCPGFGG